MPGIELREFHDNWHVLCGPSILVVVDGGLSVLMDRASQAWEVSQEGIADLSKAGKILKSHQKPGCPIGALETGRLNNFRMQTLQFLERSWIPLEISGNRWGSVCICTLTAVVSESSWEIP